MRRRIQKVALNLLKIRYVQVETPKFLKPCSLACNCKIIRDSEFDEVDRDDEEEDEEEDPKSCFKLAQN